MNGERHFDMQDQAAVGKIRTAFVMYRLAVRMQLAASKYRVYSTPFFVFCQDMHENDEVFLSHFKAERAGEG